MARKTHYFRLTCHSRRFAVRQSAYCLLLLGIFSTMSCNPNSQRAASPRASEIPEQANTREPMSLDAMTATQAVERDVDPAMPHHSASDPAYVEARRRMVEDHLAARDIVDRRVLDVMKQVPRHEFVPEPQRHNAYVDSPLPIGHGQTISQPYIVALMTQLAATQPQKKALDVGTGSGYQAAVLAGLVESVHSIEILEPLASEARERLKRLGYTNVTVRHGDGYRGWESEAPFDVIIVAAAPDHIPQPLVDQLAPGGKLVIPVGSYFQELRVIEKQIDGTVLQKNIAPVSFVPMTGDALRPR